MLREKLLVQLPNHWLPILTRTLICLETLLNSLLKTNNTTTMKNIKTISQYLFNERIYENLYLSYIYLLFSLMFVKDFLIKTVEKVILKYLCFLYTYDLVRTNKRINKVRYYLTKVVRIKIVT